MRAFIPGNIVQVKHVLKQFICKNGLVIAVGVEREVRGELVEGYMVSDGFTTAAGWLINNQNDSDLSFLYPSSDGHIYITR